MISCRDREKKQQGWEMGMLQIFGRQSEGSFKRWVRAAARAVTGRGLSVRRGQWDPRHPRGSTAPPL